MKKVLDYSQGAKIIIIINTWGHTTSVPALVQCKHTYYPTWFSKYPSERGILIPILHGRNLRLRELK